MRVVENGKTYAEKNASKKALAFAQASNMIALADDSGWKWMPWVDNLAYFRTGFIRSNATDADRRKYLLQRLGGTPHPWTARFRERLQSLIRPGR